MTLFRTVAPLAEPVTLSEAKKNLRIDHDTEDSLIEGLIRAAREDVEANCGLALIEQSWRLTLDRSPRGGLALLRRYPIREVLSVTVYGSDGEGSLVDPQRYAVDANSRPARLQLLAPLMPGVRLNGIEIDFVAGFGEAGTDVPDLIKRAILALVAHWYEFRAVYSAGDQPVSYPSGYQRLLAPWLPRRL